MFDFNDSDGFDLPETVDTDNIDSETDSDFDFGFDLDEDHTFSIEINYSSYVGKVLRIFTSGIENVTRGQMKDFLGDICLVLDYYEDSETLIVERLGLKDKYKLEKKYIEKITGARLPDSIKTASKVYYKSSRTRIKNIKKILNYKSKESALLGEIHHLLNKIGYLAEETYEPLIDQDDHMNGGFNTYGGVGSLGSYGSINSRFSNGSSNFLGSGFSGSSQGFNSFNSVGPRNSSFVNSNSNSNSGRGLLGGLFNKGNSSNSFYGTGNSMYGTGRGVKVDKSTKPIKNSEGMQVFRKDIFGNEKSVRERSSSGKKKKKPTVLMKNGKLYYVKLLGGEMLVVYVRIDQVKDDKKIVLKEDKYYYSEFGLIEPREIVWFREKLDNERGTRELKDGFRRVFSLENQLNRIYSKMAESDKVIKIEEQRQVQVLSYLHGLVIQNVKSGDLYYQSKSKIEFSLKRSNNVLVIVVKGIESKVMKMLHSKYGSDLGKVQYNSQYNILQIPLILGVRYAELKEIFLHLINIYGNGEKSRVRQEMLSILEKTLL